jgi:putative nucleotidyltransferase with HDIG domain
MDDSHSSAQNVVDILQYDQAITANILAVCNSAYFAANRPVHSLREALVRIGFNQLMEIILSRGSAFLFYRAFKGYDLEKGALWRHSVTCGLLSQVISRRLEGKSTPTQFTAGLLHDVGKVVLSEFVKDQYGEIKKLVDEKGYPFMEAEKEILGIDHAELGAKISEQWQFPEMIVSAIRYHHTPNRATQHRNLVNLIYLCDVVALLTGIGGGADGLSYQADNRVMREFHLQEKDIEKFIAEVNERMNAVENLLTLNPVGGTS